MKLTTLSYSPNKATQIAKLFHQSVHAIDPKYYSAQQKEAWAPSPPDISKWKVRLDKTKPLLAMLNGQVVGFMELEQDGHIDCAYTHPGYQNIGVASALYNCILAQAKAKNIKRLYVEASIVAKPFFERRGFALIQQNTVTLRGQTLSNFSMEKLL